MYEVEVKARLRNRKGVIKKLKSFGCKFSKELHQVDTIFAPRGTPYPLLPMGTTVLRVRKSKDKYFFTLKIPQTGHQDCIEREMEIKDGKMMIDVLKLMKWDNLPTVDKKRIKTKHKNIEIVLDKVKYLGEFIEVEKIVTHTDGEARKNIQKELCDFLEMLGIARKDIMANAKYDIMLWHKLRGK